MAKTLWPAAAGTPQTVAWTASLAAALAVVLVAAAVAVSGAQPGGPLAGPADASASASGADAIAFRHLTREQGLPNAVVYAVAQDALGFVWIGTADGLGRYDGVEVREFRHRADSTTVAGNEVQALAAGAGGEVWVGTTEGLSRYDAAYEAFRTVGGLPSENVLALAVDSSGGAWVGTDGGLARVEPGARSAAAVRGLRLPNPAVQALALDPARDALWVGTAGGLVRVNVQTGRGRGFRPAGAAAASDVSALALSERGVVLVGTTGAGLFSFDVATGAFTAVDIGPGSETAVVLSVHEDASGTVWVGLSGGGLRRLTPGAGVAVYKAAPGVADALADNQVAAILEDRQGVLWAATTQGLDRFDRASSTTTRLRHDPADPATIASSDVRAVLAATDGTLYVGTDRSLDRSRNGRTFTHTRVGAGGGAGGGRTRTVSALYESRDKTVWVGTDGAGVYRVGEAGALARVDAGGGLGALRVQAFLETRDGRFWIATATDGLVAYDREAGTTTALRQQAGALASNDVRALAETPDGTLYAATAAGLCRQRGATSAAATRFLCPAPGNPLPSDDLTALHATADGTVWAGGRRGLVRLDAQGDTTRYTAAATDLPGEAVYAITEDDAGNLWISTSGGLTQLDPVTEVFSDRLGASAGTREALGRAASRGPDGRIYVGGLRGLVSFQPRRLSKSNPNPPQVVVTEVVVSGKAVRPGPESPLAVAAPVADEIRLDYDQEYVTFRFAGLHFADPAQNEYRVRLDGFDDDWREIGTRREETYTSLDPGEYTFRVEAANPDGVRSDPGAAMTVVVSPPWWGTLWARLGFAGLVVLALVRGERWQTARLLRGERAAAETREVVLRAETAEAEKRKVEAELDRTRSVQEANTKLEAANTRLEASLADLKAAQSQLVQSEKLASLGQLTAGIAHEIKNPLNFVNNFAELSVDLTSELEEDLAAAGMQPVADVLPGLAPLIDDLRENARRIHEHGQRADRIVRAMLLHSRGGTVERARVKVNAFVEEYANLSYHGARANDPDFTAALVREFDPDSGEAEVVPQELGRVLINLLTNAFHAVQEKARTDGRSYAPEVTVRTRRDGADVEIVVADNGPGMSPDVLAKIFEPFFTTKPTGEGTGLGLSLAHDIVVQVHGGTLTVESEVGVGTRFRVCFPAGVPAPMAAA